MTDKNEVILSTSGAGRNSPSKNLRKRYALLCMKKSCWQRIVCRPMIFAGLHGIRQGQMGRCENCVIAAYEVGVYCEDRIE
jgi:hypothetical protein